MTGIHGLGLGVVMSLIPTAKGRIIGKQRHIPREHLVHHDAQAINIRTVIQFLAFHLLRRTIGQGSHESLGLGFLRLN